MAGEIQLNGLSLVTESSGSISWGSTPPTGTVIQTTQCNPYNSGNSTNVTSATAAKCVDGSGNNHWSHTISNVTVGNNVFVQMSFMFGVQRSNYFNGGAVHIYRDNTLIYTSIASANFISAFNATSDISHQNYTNLIFLDTATATSHTYFLGISANSSTVKVSTDSSHPPYICILQEIKT